MESCQNISSQCATSNIIFCYILLSLIVARGINGQFCGTKVSNVLKVDNFRNFEKKDSFHFHYVEEFIKVRVKQSQ